MALSRFLLVIFGVASLAAGARAADPPGPRPYEGIQAGLDAFRLAEERRQAEFAQQSATNSQLASWNAWPAYPAATIYGDPLAIWGLPPAIVVAPAPLPPAAFGWGYSVYRAALPARQPVGRVEVQIGPRRWESHPIYDPPLAGYLPSPLVASPLLEETPYAFPYSPEPASDSPAPAAGDPPPPPAARPPAAFDRTVPPPPPPLPPRRGPREF